MLCACLSAIQSLGPDLTDLLCGPGTDVGAWTLFFHPSFRTVSAHDPLAQPSLASLTAVLELYDSHASKVKSVCVCLSVFHGMAITFLFVSSVEAVDVHLFLMWWM